MYTTEERIKMYTLFSCGASLREVSALFAAEFPDRPIPSISTVRTVVQKFKSGGCVNVHHTKKRSRTSAILTEDMEIKVLASVENNNELSSRQIAAECGISPSSVLRILKKRGYKSFKFENHQELNVYDAENRINFCEKMFEIINRNEIFLRKILFTDESTFIKHGEPNSQNCRYWATKNLHRYHSTRTQYPQKVNVWAGIVDGHIIGPFFIEGTLTGPRYLQLLQDRIIPALNDLHLEGPLWYMHDGAPAHYSLQVREFLNLNFPGRWIGRGGVIDWPPRSPDLTPLDFFYWGKLKSSVYNASPINNIEELKARIIASSRAITALQCEAVLKEFYNRLGYCLLENGDIFENKLR